MVCSSLVVPVGSLATLRKVTRPIWKGPPPRNETLTGRPLKLETTSRTVPSLRSVRARQPATATATARAIRVQRPIRWFFMGWLRSRELSDLDDSRCDEDEELVVLLTPRLVFEQVADDRKVGQAGHPALAVVAGDLVDAADDGGAAVADHQPGAGILGGDRRVGGTGDGEGRLLP